MNPQDRLGFTADLAEKAGKLILSFLNSDKQEESKSNAADIVTIADKRSEELIFNSIRSAFPGDSILGEEGGNHTGDSGYTWVVDPLDGTMNFAHSYPMFCVSIGLIDSERKPVLGMVFHPVSGEKFHAVKNGGAFLNGEKISVSGVTSLEKALTVTGFPYYRSEAMERLLGRLRNFLLATAGMRRSGSAALDLCYVACGRCDIYYEEGLKPWDAAAASLILTEAGGRMSDFSGGEFDLFRPEAFGSNPALFEAALPLLSF